MALTVARLALSAWVGAAVLFVVTSVREIRHEGFDSATRDTLAALRFPDYYACGFILAGVSFVAAAIGLVRGALRRRRAIIALGLLAVALALMAGDYLWIYRPMADMILPPGQPKPASFETLHVASEWINTADVGLCLIAAALLNWPADRPGSPRPNA